MSAIAEKGGGSFHGIKLLLCENPLPPLDEAVAAAQAEAPARRTSPRWCRLRSDSLVAVKCLDVHHAPGHFSHRGRSTTH